MIGKSKKNHVYKVASCVSDVTRFDAGSFSHDSGKNHLIKISPTDLACVLTFISMPKRIAVDFLMALEMAEV